MEKPPLPSSSCCWGTLSPTLGSRQNLVEEYFPESISQWTWMEDYERSALQGGLVKITLSQSPLYR